MHINQDKEAVRLKVSLSLETLAGERISEVKTDQVFRDMFGAHVLDSAEATLHELLETQVVTPCRALIRMHVNKLRERSAFTRLDPPAGTIDWGLLALLQPSPSMVPDLHLRRVKPSSCQRRKAPDDYPRGDESNPR